MNNYYTVQVQLVTKLLLKRLPENIKSTNKKH
jgi:hypothetical protein